MAHTTAQKQESSATLDDRILRELTQSERDKSVVYLDEEPRPPGRDSIGGRDYQHETPCLVAFIDQRPGSNWMHSCRYLLIDPAADKIASINSDRPPLFGALPPSWRIVWRSPDIDDWRLLPIARRVPPESQREEKQ